MTASTPPCESSTGHRSFADFVAVDGARLGRVLVAQFGVETGRDLCADAMAYAWANWTTVEAMANPAGYLYRVARSSFRWHRRWRQRIVFPVEFPVEEHRDADGDIFRSLQSLTVPQRTCVVLIHAHLWSYAEVADVLGISQDAVRNHVHRGLRRLRTMLEQEKDT
jgi:RNA polymerase sigma factor (sigma-70 family)